MVITYSRVQNGKIPPPVRDYIAHRLYHHQDYLNDYETARQELEQHKGNGTSAGDVVFWGEMVRAVSTAIEKRALFRELYTLHYEQRLSGAETAARLGVSVATFNKLRRGLIQCAGSNMGILW